MVYELYLLIGSIVSKAVIDNNIKSIPLAPHVDDEGYRVSHMHRASHALPLKTIARPHLHEALRGSQGEHYGVGWVRSEREF